ncbi:SHOCT domain-containing protein [Peptacetobacter sp. AB845]|uniref:SHOCT domain-containing protein n=1 Tax=Peptacetobacter sp. AB845 TaxID=3388429 RepID=UPI0039C8E46A
MDKNEFKREKLYQATMLVAKKMLKNGIISIEEYQEIDVKMNEKYKPIFGTLLSQNDLI